MDYMRVCVEKSINIIGYSSENYPPQLRHIENPPAVIYCKGNVNCLCGTKTVTAVGTRNATGYALYATEKICGELAEKNYVIVSGFAVGIDITASLAAVRKHRPTVCVLGCGADIDYPRENTKFKKEILKNGGLFITEYPVGTPPYGTNFPRRNRILSALGRALIVFQAGDKSGALITANLAAEQGRDVFCLPPPDIFADNFIGNIMLLKDGAYALYDTEDIDELFREGSPIDEEIHETDYPETGVFRTGSHENIPETVPVSEYLKVKNNDKNDNEISAVSQEYDGLTELQRNIVEILRNGSVHADILAAELSVDAGELFIELTELEIQGIIKSLPGKMFEINN
jgi:DNA processing protein